MSFDGDLRLPPTDASLNFLSQEYSYQDVFDATEGFSSSSRLGQGTYGSVYQGTLRDGTEVAVKVLSKPNEAGFREEVEVLSKFRHPNLVILMGFARNSKERYLVYELLPGGDVCARLQKDSSFVWRPRLNVALDSALGLSHLHCARPQVFHRDIKTQNILMDRNGTGKMADFGLALLAQPNCESLTVEHTSGTIGYADPLYIRTGVVTERSEVYSFGMVLLELLTGRPPALQHVSGRIEYQFAHIAGEISRVQAMLDPRARWPSTLAVTLGQLSLKCVSSQETTRPTFVEIVKELRQFLRAHPENSTGAPVGSTISPMATVQAEPKATARNGPFLGVGQTPAWATSAQRQRGVILERQTDRESPLTAVSPTPANANYSAMSHGEGDPPDGVRIAQDRMAAGDMLDGVQIVQERRISKGGVQILPDRSDSSRPFVVSGRSSTDSCTGALQQTHDPISSFSKIGASLYAAADSTADCDGAAPHSGSGSGYLRKLPSGLQGRSGNTQSDITQPVRAIHPARIVQMGEPSLVASRSSEQRLQGQQASSFRNDQRGSSNSAAPQGHPSSRLLQVVSSVDELVDESPTCVVDCGAPEEKPPNPGVAPDRWNEPARSAYGGKPFLLPFAFPTGGAGSMFPQQPLGATELGGASSSNGVSGENAATKNKDQEQEEMYQRLQDEMGFSRHQVTEAFKRCSTAEAAIDWILSPEREWAETWNN